MAEHWVESEVKKTVTLSVVNSGWKCLLVWSSCVLVSMELSLLVFFLFLRTIFLFALKRIPPAFVKYIAIAESQRAILKGPSGNIWHCRLSRSSTGMYLHDGWEHFVEDHSLKISDLLLFGYDGNLCFTVRIFDKTACEREDAFTCKNRQATPSCRGRKKCRRAKKISSSSSDHSQDACESDTKDRKIDHIHDPHKSRYINTDSNHGQVMLSLQTSDHVKIEMDDVDMLTPKTKFYSMGVGDVSKWCPPVTKERIQVYEKVKHFTSKFPCILFSMKKYQVNPPRFLDLPVCFSRVYLPKTRMDMVFRDPKGREWEVNFIGRGFSAGWRAFSLGNDLREGDACIFELVTNCQMQVHIFRLV